MVFIPLTLALLWPKISIQGSLLWSEAMTIEYPSLILALDQLSTANSNDSHSSEVVSEPSAEYSFTINLDRIDRAPPTFTKTTDGCTGGKVLHGTLVAQNVFEQEKLRGRGAVSVACPKRWNLRLLIWRKLGDVENGTEVQCQGTLTESRSRHQPIQTLATQIPGCYPVIGYLGIMVLLSPIICIVWPMVLLAKIFYPGLIVLLIARVAFFIWPNLITAVDQFDLFLLIYVLFGGVIKFYGWAVTLGSEDDSIGDSEADDSTHI